MSIIHVINCGGLGNRLNNIVNGIYLSEVLERPLRVTWPLNDACFCPYNDLFINTLTVDCVDSAQEPITIDDYNRLAGSDAVLYKRKWPESISNKDISGRFREYGDTRSVKRLLKELKQHTGSILLQGPTILPFVPTRDVIKILGRFQVVDSLSADISGCLASEKIDKSVIGAHIRLTDSASINKEACLKRIRKIISANSRQRIFVCSDASEIERELRTLYPENIITHEKTSYAEKKDPASQWDERGTRSLTYNVTRSKESVQQAVVDLFLLSNTNLRIRSQGTFSKIAHYISLSDWEKNRKKYSITDALFLYGVRKFT